MVIAGAKKKIDRIVHHIFMYFVACFDHPIHLGVVRLERIPFEEC